MNLSEYILLSREERMAHVNLESDCICPNVTRGTSMPRARKALLTLLSLNSDIHGKYAQCCHLCKNHTRSGSVCVNPYHLYIGTPRENQLDIDTDVRNARMKKMREAAMTMRDEEYIRNWVEIVQKAHKEKVSYEDRVAAGKRGSEKVSPEVRSDRSRRGWETRRRNQQGG